MQTRQNKAYRIGTGYFTVLLKGIQEKEFKRTISKVLERSCLSIKQKYEINTEWRKNLVLDGSYCSYIKKNKKPNTLQSFWKGRREEEKFSAIPANIGKNKSLPLMLLLNLHIKLFLPDLNMTCDIKRSCKVLMLSHPGRNTRIAPSYI